MVLYLLSFPLVTLSSQNPHRSLKYHIVPQRTIKNRAWKIDEQPQHRWRKYWKTVKLSKAKPNQHLSIKPNDLCTLSKVQWSMPKDWVLSCWLSPAGSESKAKTKGEREN